MIQKPRGTRDLLPEYMAKRRTVGKVMIERALSYGFGEVCTPMFEELELFTMKSGQGVIEEIYAFKDKSGRDLALRPELTAAVIRLYCNNMLDTPKPVKVFYSGSCFRYERPQAGRYREFKQFGAEVIGGDELPTAIEILTLALDILGRTGVKGLRARVGYLDVLRTLFEELGVKRDTQGSFMTLIDKSNFEGLKDQFIEKGMKGPLTKIILEIAAMNGKATDIMPKARTALKDYPRCLQALDKLKTIIDGVQASGLASVKEIFVDLGIARGLDYYTGMVFEIDIPDLGAEKQVCGGGAYALTELFGVEAMNSVGFAIGVDRLILGLENQKAFPVMEGPMFYLIPFKGTEASAMEILRVLREANLSTDVDLSGRTLSKNLKYAAAIRARFAVIVGQKELDKGVVVIRDLASGKQVELPFKGFVEAFKKCEWGQAPSEPGALPEDTDLEKKKTREWE
jgi:histidyl-tRNA synthetase